MKKRIITTGKVHKNDTQPKDEVRQKNIKSLIEKINSNLEEKLKYHVEEECKAHNISLVYKKLNGNFGPTLPSIVNAKNSRTKS